MNRTIAIVWPLFFASGCAPLYHPDFESPPDWVDEVPLQASDECQVARVVRVTCVIDGDTFDIGECGLVDDERFRLLGVDAPEIAHGSNPADCYGPEAEVALRQLLAGREVLLTYDAPDVYTDNLLCTGLYGRDLVYVWLPDSGVDPRTLDPAAPIGALLVNEWLLELGLAYVYHDNSGIRLKDRFDGAEQRASDSFSGLWRACEAEGG